MSINFIIILMILSAITNAFFGIVVYFSNRNKTGRLYLLLSLSFCLWMVPYAIWLMQGSEVGALFWSRMLNAAATLIPILFFHWIVSFLNLDKKKKWFLGLFYLITLFFLMMSYSNLYISGVTPVGNFPFWPQAGILYTIFLPICFVLLFSYGIILLYKNAIYDKPDSEEKTNAKYLLIGSLVSVLGGSSNFPLMYGFDNPFIFLTTFTIFQPIFWTYGSIKHRLFNMKVFTTEAFLFVLWASILTRTLLADTVREQMINGALLLGTIIVGVFLIRSVKNEIEQKEKIEKLADELKKVNDGQTSLIHFMNHQIKGRFGITKNIFAELLTDDYGTMPPATIPLLQKGLDEANIGVSYVMGILKGASAESGTLNYDKNPMDLKSIVEEVFSAQKEFAEKKGLKIDLRIEDGDYSMLGDKVQMGEAVKNLIDNSISYTPDGRISVHLSQKDSKMLFKITDTGIGITLEDMPNLFKAGGRGVNSLKVNVNATGYGLVFVRGVARAHGGHVWAESEGHGKGSTFFMELPKEAPTESLKNS